MKTVIKLLFVVVALFVSFSYLKQANLLDAVVFTIAFVALFTGVVVPYRFFKTDRLNVITDMKVWNKYIIEKLRKTNEFLFQSSDESGNVLGGAIVYIPQAGADPVVEVNSNAYPGVAVVRADNDVNYALDYYRTVPSHIPWAEIQTISYDKIDSVVKGHTNTLSEAVADVMLTKWAPTVAGKIISTSGGDIEPIGNQVGNRKGFDHTDLKRAMIAMNVANVPKKGRIAVIDDSMYEFFYDSLTQSWMNSFNQFANNETGVVGKLHSFTIYTRSSVLAYANNVAAPNAYGAALLAGDNLASLCWHPDMVARAIGDTKPFQRKDDPLYYGDVWSMILRAGGRKKRADNNGVIAIVQGQ